MTRLELDMILVLIEDSIVEDKNSGYYGQTSTIKNIPKANIERLVSSLEHIFGGEKKR